MKRIQKDEEKDIITKNCPRHCGQPGSRWHVKQVEHRAEAIGQRWQLTTAWDWSQLMHLQILQYWASRLIEAVLSQAVEHCFGDVIPPTGADGSCDGEGDHASSWLGLRAPTAVMLKRSYVALWDTVVVAVQTLGVFSNLNNPMNTNTFHSSLRLQ